MFRGFGHFTHIVVDYLGPTELSGDNLRALQRLYHCRRPLQLVVERLSSPVVQKCLAVFVQPVHTAVYKRVISYYFQKNLAMTYGRVLHQNVHVNPFQTRVLGRRHDCRTFLNETPNESDANSRSYCKKSVVSCT